MPIYLIPTFLLTLRYFIFREASPPSSPIRILSQLPSSHSKRLTFITTLQLFLLKAVALPVLLVAGFPRSQFNCLIIYMGPAFRPTCWLPFRRIPKPRWRSSVLLSVYAWAEQGNSFQSPSSMVWPTSTGYHTRRDPQR